MEISKDMTNVVPGLIKEVLNRLRSKAERNPYGISKTKRKKWGYLPSYKTVHLPDGRKQTVRIY